MNITKGNTLSHKVEVNLHVFSALMLNGVLGHVDGTDIVAIHKSCSLEGSAEFCQQLA